MKTKKLVVIEITIEKKVKNEDRKTILLKAAYDLLMSNENKYILPSLVFYDGTECDAYCLTEDIADELGIKHEA